MATRKGTSAYSSSIRMNEAIPARTTEQAASLTAQVGRYARVVNLPADAVVDLIETLGLDDAPFVERSLSRHGYGAATHESAA